MTGTKRLHYIVCIALAALVGTGCGPSEQEIAAAKAEFDGEAAKIIAAVEARAEAGEEIPSRIAKLGLPESDTTPSVKGFYYDYQTQAPYTEGGGCLVTVWLRQVDPLGEGSNKDLAEVGTDVCDPAIVAADTAAADALSKEAAAEMPAIKAALTSYFDEHGDFPTTLAELGLATDAVTLDVPLATYTYFATRTFGTAEGEICLYLLGVSWPSSLQPNFDERGDRCPSQPSSTTVSNG